jgi:hypothetical protein
MAAIDTAALRLLFASPVNNHRIGKQKCRHENSG